VSRSGGPRDAGFRQFFIGASRCDQSALVDCDRNPTRGAAMSRFMLALVAAATAAVAAIAVVALPAIGDDNTSHPDIDAFVACLRAHGLPGAPSDPVTLKPWLASKDAGDPLTVKRAMKACDNTLPSKPAVSAPGPDIDTVIACVRRQGIDAPTAPMEFKQWLGRQQSADSSPVRAALQACKLALDPGPKPGAGKCVAPADKPPADDPPADKPPADGPETPAQPTDEPQAAT
jgi:hypothetical protein